MGNRTGQFDVAHSFAAHLGQRHLHTTLLAHHTAVFQALILATETLVVAHRPEQLGTEQAISLRLESTVVDGLRFFHLTPRPRADLFGRSESDTNVVEILFFNVVLGELTKQIFHCFSSDGLGSRV